MKKVNRFALTILLVVCSLSASAAVIPLSSGNVANAFYSAGDGDIIELTTNGGSYTWSGYNSVSLQKSVTIRAQAGLTTRPVISFAANCTPGAIYYLSAPGTYKLTLEGIEFNGGGLQTTLVQVNAAATSNASITIENCKIKNFTSNGSILNYASNVMTDAPLVVSNTIIESTGISLYNNAWSVGYPTSVTLSNCYFKGIFTNGVINQQAYNAAGTVSNTIDHCTFDGNSTAELKLYNKVNGTTTITNTLFANNTGSSSNILGGSKGTNANLDVSNCGIYYTGTGSKSTIYPTSGANTLSANPRIISSGIATNSAYIGTATDGKNIGYNNSSPIISTSVTSLNSYTYLQGTGPSAEQSFEVGGANLSGNIILTAPANYEISTGTGASFVSSSPISLEVSAGIVPLTKIYVRLKAGLTISNYQGNILVQSTGIADINVSVTGSVFHTVLNTSVIKLNGFAYFTGSGPSSEQSFNVSGTNFTSNLLIKAPANYEISSTSGNAFVSESTITLIPMGGTVANSTIYVRLKAGLTANAYTENIELTSADATPTYVEVNGLIKNPPVVHQIPAPADISTYLTSLADGDIIELTTNGGVYTWSANILVSKYKSFVIRAAAGLSSRPIIKAASNYTGGLFTYSAAGGTSILLKGIEFTGNDLLNTLMTFTCDELSNYNITVDNCYIHGLSAIANAITYGGALTVSNQSTLTLSNSIFNFNGGSVYYNPYSNNCPQNIVISNCYFKGIYSTGVIETTFSSVKNATIDHCTFDGNTGYDLGLRGSSIVSSIKNTIFANNTGTTNNVFGNASLNGTKCAVYYTGTGAAGTIYPTLTGSNALLTNPAIDAYGNATAAEYINAGTDGKTIGCYFEPPVTPNVNVSTDKLTKLSYEMNFGPSSEQSFTVSGVNLIDNLTITPSANYEISLTSGNGFSSNIISLTPTAKTVNTTTIFVRLKSGLQNNAYFENISIITSNAPDHLVSCQGIVNFAPFLLTDLIYTFGQGPSAEKTFIVSGFNLVDNISVVPPSNYEISLGTGSQFITTNPIVFTPTNGNVTKTIVYARLKSNLDVNSYNEKVVLMSSQATEKYVTLTGKVDTVATAINNTFENEFAIYPTAGGLRLHVQEAGQQIEFFNAIGQKIKSLKSKSGDNYIQLSGGIYILKVGIKTQKIIL